MEYEARYYRVEDGKGECLLCPVHCRIAPGRTGKCMGRTFIAGKLLATNYGEVGAQAVDPIEKKPLYHFHPGRDILSIGPNGCNLDCQFCQNWTLSQTPVVTQFISPEDLVSLASKHESIGVAYTYSEPLIWFEYLMDSMPLLHRAGLKTVLVTNGYINPEPFSDLIPHVDAMNVDLKSMNPEFYRKYCKGALEPVIKTIEASVGQCHLEITSLVIPGLNDSPAEVGELASWIARLDRHIPLHLSAYFPNYKFDVPATATETLKGLYEKAREHLHYVFMGNVSLPRGNDTWCPECGACLIRRQGYQVKIEGLSGNTCTACGTTVPIVLDLTANGFL